METRGERLRKARIAAGFSSARAAANALNVPTSTYNSHERAGTPGGRDFDPEYTEQYARRFRVTAEWLLTGKMVAKKTVEESLVVPVVGKVSAGNVIYFDGEQHADEWVEAPPGSPPDTVAVKIDGESLGPIFVDGWLAFYAKREPAITDAMVGRLCIVGTADGRTMIKKVRRGRLPNTYDLQSGTGAIEDDVDVVWAAKVFDLRQR